MSGKTGKVESRTLVNNHHALGEAARLYQGIRSPVPAEQKQLCVA